MGASWEGGAELGGHLEDKGVGEEKEDVWEEVVDLDEMIGRRADPLLTLHRPVWPSLSGQCQ